jgi:hypothetical protein
MDLQMPGVWDIPIFKNGSKWEGRFLGGWQVAERIRPPGLVANTRFVRYQLRRLQAELSVRP